MGEDRINETNVSPISIFGQNPVMSIMTTRDYRTTIKCSVHHLFGVRNCRTETNAFYAFPCSQCIAIVIPIFLGNIFPSVKSRQWLYCFHSHVQGVWPKFGGCEIGFPIACSSPPFDSISELLYDVLERSIHWDKSWGARASMCLFVRL